MSVSNTSNCYLCIMSQVYLSARPQTRLAWEMTDLGWWWSGHEVSDWGPIVMPLPLQGPSATLHIVELLETKNIPSLCGLADTPTHHNGWSRDYRYSGLMHRQSRCGLDEMLMQEQQDTFRDQLGRLLWLSRDEHPASYCASHLHLKTRLSCLLFSTVHILQAPSSTDLL